MMELARSRRVSLVALAVLFGILLIGPPFLSAFLLTLATQALIYAMLAAYRRTLQYTMAQSRSMTGTLYRIWRWLGA